MVEQIVVHRRLSHNDLRVLNLMANDGLLTAAMVEIYSAAQIPTGHYGSTELCFCTSALSMVCYKSGVVYKIGFTIRLGIIHLDLGKPSLQKKR